MFNFLKRKKTDPSPEVDVPVAEKAPPSEGTVAPKKSILGRLKDSLQKTRRQWQEGIATLFLGRKQIDAALWAELETHLLLADLGVEATQAILKQLTDSVNRKALNDPQALYDALKQSLTQLLLPCEKPLSLPALSSPYVILVVGVNGAGKTTTIGKLSYYLTQSQKSVMLAAGDTFRAAAIEQLQVWGERNQLPVIAQQINADSAAVIFDALQSAKAKSTEVLIADTAGRLHTRSNLMEELKKIIRVLKKIDPAAPHEILLVLDAGNGQNALAQAQTFHEALNVTGLVLTKLDGTAKGGIIFAIAQKLKLPIRFIGVGETLTDLRPFKAEEFVKALFE